MRSLGISVFTIFENVGALERKGQTRRSKHCRHRRRRSAKDWRKKKLEEIFRRGGSILEAVDESEEGSNRCGHIPEGRGARVSARNWEEFDPSGSMAGDWRAWAPPLYQDPSKG